MEMIEDLTVENDYIPAVSGAHRLRAAFGKLYDCEPAVPECDSDRLVDYSRAGVRPTMAQGLCHAFDRAKRLGPRRCEQNTCYSTHFLFSG
jgi:hypothetical protein